MRAHFSDLKWRTYDPEGYPNQYDGGDWDGFDFPTSLYLDAPYSININEPYCKFDVSGGTGKILAIYVCTHGGTTKPAPGPYAHDYGSSVTVTANAEPDWRFLSWVLDGTVKYANPITLTMNSDHTLKTYFCGSGGGGEICPTLFVWDGSDYNDLGVIDIHADEDVVREVPVPSEIVGINEHKAQFRLREGWEGLTYSHSEIDQVKLLAVDDDGNQGLCPLVKATHSELGNVQPQLLLSDNQKCDMYLLETIDLTFVVPSQTDEFVFVIEGCNMLKY